MKSGQVNIKAKALKMRLTGELRAAYLQAVSEGKVKTSKMKAL
jgi:hypothetical protein